VKKDFHEKEPIDLSALTVEEKKVKDMLKGIIQSYQNTSVEVTRGITEEELKFNKLRKVTDLRNGHNKKDKKKK